MAADVTYQPKVHIVQGGATLEVASGGAITADSGSTVTLAGDVAITGAATITTTSPTQAIGYATGAGGAATQLTNRSTGVTCSFTCGAITTDTTSLAAGAEASFAVTNTTVAVGDVVVVCARSGQTAATSVPHVTGVGAGSFTIQLTNLSAVTADTGAMIINFAVIKAVGA